MLGGSSIFGWDVLEESLTIPRLIENMDERLEVINAGVLGYSSAQELGLYIEDIYELRPDIVICYNFWNDIFFSLQAGEEYLGVNNIYNGIEILLREYYIADTRPIPGLMLFARNLFFKTNIGKGRQVYLKDVNILHELDRVNNELKTDFSNPRIAASIKLYQKNMKIFSNILSADGIKFIVILQPELNRKKKITKQEWDSQRMSLPNYQEYFAPIYAHALPVAEKYFEQENILYLNMNEEEEFISNETTLFIDFVHNNTEGNKIIASIIYRYLLDNKLI